MKESTPKDIGFMSQDILDQIKNEGVSKNSILNKDKENLEDFQCPLCSKILKNPIQCNVC